MHRGLLLFYMLLLELVEEIPTSTASRVPWCFNEAVRGMLQDICHVNRVRCEQRSAWLTLIAATCISFTHSQGINHLNCDQ